ncbi:MAG: nucleoside hydrolase, partial [Clostridia bacterium]|nr:nucleoside hydrolase [Clostridia bacterium]
FGEEAPPVGIMVDGTALKDCYAKGVSEGFAASSDKTEAPSAVSVLRRTLAESNEKCVICAVGPLTNIGALLQSEADEISPLSGTQLVREKCDKMVLMAGGFVPDESGKVTAEWNVKCDIPAAQAVSTLCPVPIAWLPFETGFDMITGKPLMDKYGMDSPISMAFILFRWAKDGRHSWDPATALYAVEGVGEWFSEVRGRVTVTDEGITVLSPDSEGMHCVINMNTEGRTVEQAKKVTAEYLDGCVMKLHAERV